MLNDKPLSQGLSKRSFLSAAACTLGGAVLGGGLVGAAQATTSAPAYRGNQHRPTSELLQRLAQSEPEKAIEPGLPIVDPHHHLFGTSADPLYYRREDMEQDFASGHKIMGTVYVAAYKAGWRKDGPEDWKSLGEFERIVALSQTPLQTPHGNCQMAAGIVSEVSLLAGDALEDILAAHVAAADGRLRGVRYYATYHDSELKNYIHNAPRHMLADPKFRQGLAVLQRMGLSYDALIYHTQFQELMDLADAFPNMPLVLNHVGMPIGVRQFEPDNQAVRDMWESGMRALALRPNVRVKVGGMGMPIFGFGFEYADKPATSQQFAKAWQPMIDVCVEAFGPNRCMLESNFPVDKQSGGYGELWNAFKLATASLSPSERQSLFYRTACQTYQLPQLEAACDAAFKSA